MAGTNVGRVEASIVPEVSGFAAQADSALTPVMERLGRKLGKTISRSLKTQLRTELRDFKPEVKVGIKLDQQSVKSFKAQVAKLTRPVTLPVRIQMDMPSIAYFRAHVANLTRPREMNVSVNLQGAAQAQASLAALSRDHTSHVRVDVDRSVASAVGSITSAAASAAGSLASLASKGVLLASLIPIAGGVASAIAAIAPAAAVAVPAIAMVGSAFAAVKIGTSGVGAAIKAAFAPATGQGKAAASAAKQVASAQQGVRRALEGVADARRGVARAVEQVKVAREKAAAANAAAARSVASAERDVTDAQRSAREAQESLNEARKEAKQDLMDLQNQLQHSVLDERAASLALQEAKIDLDKVMANPNATELMRQEAQLTYDQAVLHLKDQKKRTKDLTKEESAARKAGVDGSKKVIEAKQAEADAQRGVKDATQALAVARQQAAMTARDGARSITQAQRGVEDANRRVADAERAVADAQRRVTEAQTSGTVQASKFSQAMAKLSPNARSFVNAVKGLKPAWDSLKMGVQNALFAGLGTKLTSVANNVLPVLKTGLTGVAGVMNDMAKSALTAVDNLAKSGMLKKILDGAKESLKPLADVPGKLVTGLGQVAIAAQPAMQRISEGLAGAVSRISDKMTKAFESGAMEDAINHAVDLIVDLMDVGQNVFKILGDIFQAGEGTGGGTIQVLKDITEQIAKITSSKEVQGGLKALFSVVGKFFKMVGPLLGIALKGIGKVMQAIEPALNVLIDSMGKSFGPLLEALIPVVVQVAKVLGGIVKAVAPLLPVMTKLLITALKPLTPVFKIIGDLIAKLAPVISQLAEGLGKALTPILQSLGTVLKEMVSQYADLFLSILKQLLPVLPTLIGVLVTLGKCIGQILVAVAPLIPKILQLAMMFIVKLLPVLVKILPIVAKVITILLKFATWLIVKILVPILTWLVKKVEWTFDKIGKVISWLWHHVVKPVFGWIADKAKWLYNHAIKPAFNWIADKAKWLYHKALKPAFDGMKTAIRKVGDAFDGVKDFIGRAWDKIKDLAKKPVKFVIDTIYNGGIVPLWNKVAGLVGAGKLHKLHLKGFAGGGILPGQSRYSQGDDQMVPMRRGEGVYVSEAMRDPYERARLFAVNKAAMAGQSLARFRDQRGYAKGGIVGDIFGGIGSLFSKGVDLLKNGLKGAAKLALKPVSALLDKIPGSGSWMGLIKDVPKKFVSKLLGFFDDKSDDVPKVKGNFGHGVTRWAGVVQTALRLLGQPLSLTGATLRRMNQESGGNPTIVNRWDSNWRAGTPSVGLMQVIGPTFRHYAGRFRNRGPFMYGTSVDPLANIYASMRYALSRYGSLAAAYNRAGGYARGGTPRRGELAWVGEEGPELVRFGAAARVYSHQQSMRMARTQVGTPPVGAEQVRDVHFHASVTDKPTRQAVLDATRDYNALYGAQINY